MFFLYPRAYIDHLKKTKRLKINVLSGHMKSRVNTQNKKLQVIFNTSLYLNTRRNK